MYVLMTKALNLFLHPFLLEDVFRKKKTQAQSPTHAQANRFIQLAFLASCPNLLLIKNRENYEQSVSFIT